MNIATREINYKDINDLSVELEYIIACNKVEKRELVRIILLNTDAEATFKSSASKLLKAMKREGVIKLFVFESELSDTEKMETVYLLNKFPELSKIADSSSSIYIKL